MAESETPLKLVAGMLPVLTVVGGSVWALFTYFQDQKSDRLASKDIANKDAATRVFEAQQPFLTKQFELYIETTQVIGKLTTASVGSDDWISAKRRYDALYWSELATVESRLVEAAMVNFRKCLVKAEEADTPDNIHNLKLTALQVAHAVRSSLEDAWTIQGFNVLGPTQDRSPSDQPKKHPVPPSLCEPPLPQEVEPGREVR
jgi:hypothetical protein